MGCPPWNKAEETMAQLIRDPIDIHVEPRVRAILGHDGRNYKDQVPEVADIQIVISVLSKRIQLQQKVINDLQLKVKRQKTKLTELENNLLEYRKKEEEHG